MNNGFLPVSRAEMEERGIKQFDFVYVIGDAYVDHPSFGHAIISRLLEAHGYSVGIISQPDWRDKESVCIFGEPRLGFLVSAGNMDSMVNQDVYKRQVPCRIFPFKRGHGSDRRGCVRYGFQLSG